MGNQSPHSCFTVSMSSWHRRRRLTSLRALEGTTSVIHTSDGSRRQRTASRAQRILGEPGSRTWDCGVSPATGYVTGRGRSRDREGGPAALPPLALSRQRSPEAHWPLGHVAPPSLTTPPPSWERASLGQLAALSRSHPQRPRKLRRVAGRRAALECVRAWTRRQAGVPAPSAIKRLGGARRPPRPRDASAAGLLWREHCCLKIWMCIFLKRNV